ncbi:MAG TPA: DUF3142 domain-containing protein [Croceibacterium sp.]
MLLGACSRDEPQPGGIDPADYTAFFLWAGVRPPEDLARAERVYLLWGEVRRGDPSRVIVLRPEPPRAAQPEIWLAVRAERLDWSEEVYRQLLTEVGRWRARGNRVAGIQVDFDAATLRLGTYAAFLRDLRRRMPAELQLSATGLMDWSSGAGADDLAALEGVIDELVVQTYQGRATIPGYQRYLPSLERLAVPYRIGLIEGGEWQAPAGLERDPEFEGYVVFLQ